MPLPAIAMKPFTFALSPLRSALLAAVLCLPGVGYMAGAQAQLALPSMGDGADLTASEERRCLQVSLLILRILSAGQSII